MQFIVAKHVVHRIGFEVGSQKEGIGSIAMSKNSRIGPEHAIYKELDEILSAYEYSDEDKSRIQKIVASIAESVSQYVQDELLRVLPLLIMPGEPKPLLNSPARGLQQDDELGVAYYNLDLGNTSKVIEFIAEHSDNHFSISQVRAEEVASIENDHKVFCKVVKKALEKEPLDERDASYVQRRISPIIEPGDPKVAHFERERVIQRRYSRGFLGHLMYRMYRWFILLAEGEIQVQKCAVHECSRIFLIKPGGHPQKFCSAACRMKAYRDQRVLEPLKDDGTR